MALVSSRKKNFMSDTRRQCRQRLPRIQRGVIAAICEFRQNSFSFSGEAGRFIFPFLVSFRGHFPANSLWFAFVRASVVSFSCDWNLAKECDSNRVKSVMALVSPARDPTVDSLDNFVIRSFRFAARHDHYLAELIARERERERENPQRRVSV